MMPFKENGGSITRVFIGPLGTAGACHLVYRGLMIRGYIPVYPTSINSANDLLVWIDFACQRS